jgi:hypothetical protein
MFPARKNKNTRGQNRPMVFAAVASANAERDSLFRPTNQLEEGLLAETAHSDELGTLPAFAPESLTTTTRFFQDVVLFPMVLRALFGEKLKQLCAENKPHVTRSVAFFLAACRHGGVN